MRVKKTVAATFGPFGEFDQPGLLVVKANGGTVQVEYMLNQDPAEFVTHATFSEDKAHEIQVRNAVIRITPTGGAEYLFEPEREFN